MKCLLVLAAIVSGVAAGDCISCICNKESNCRAIGCNMDQGTLSCGYFQIKLPYYQDCGQPGKQSWESTEAAWKRCSDDYNCALTCVNNYIARYSFMCPGKGTCERISRLHNGGLNGCNAGYTQGYWNDVKNCCNCS